MSRRKRRTPPGQVQASRRAWIWFMGLSSRANGKSQAWFTWRGAHYRGNHESLEACIEEIKQHGFGAYTYEGKTTRLRSRFAVRDRAATDRCQLAVDTCQARTSDLRRWRGGCAHASQGWERLSQVYTQTTCFTHRGCGVRSCRSGR